MAYQPKQSKLAANLNVGDAKVWREKLAVCEGVTKDGEPKLIVRSYFKCDDEDEGSVQPRVWDEPPSGASQVIHATQAMHDKAQQQLNELRWTLDAVPPEDLQASPTKGSPSKKSPRKAPFSFLRKKKPPTLKDESKDLNLQRAIALSMADQGSSTVAAVSPSSSYGNGIAHTDEEEALLLAQALSLSEQQKEPIQLQQDAIEKHRAQFEEEKMEEIAGPETTYDLELLDKKMPPT